MYAISLNHRIQIEQAAEASDGTGDPVRTWSLVATLWASVNALTGREAFNAKQVLAEVTHRVTIRYRTGLTPKMRVKFDGRYFDILSVLDAKETKVWLELMCVERIGGVSG